MIATDINDNTIMLDINTAGPLIILVSNQTMKASSVFSIVKF